MVDQVPSLTLPPLTDEEWPPSLAALRGGFATRLNVYRVMAHDPDLLRAWAPLREHLVTAGGLDDQQREIVILRVGFRWGAGYEWAHHVSRGRAAGLDDVRIGRAALGPADWPEGEEDGLLLTAVDALLDDARLPTALIAALSERLSRQAIMDMMALVGFYTTLAFIAKTFAVPIEPELEGLTPDWAER